MTFISDSKIIAILSCSLTLLTALTSFGQEIERHPKEAHFEVGKEDYVKEGLVIGPFPRKFETDFLNCKNSLQQPVKNLYNLYNFYNSSEFVFVI